MEEGEEITGQRRFVMLIWGKEINLVVAFFFFFVLNCKLPIIAEQYVILFFFFATPSNLYVRYKLTS